MRPSNMLGGRLIALAALLLGLLIGSVAASADDAAGSVTVQRADQPLPIGALAIRQTWAEGVDLVRSGKFDEAATLLGRIIGSASESAETADGLKSWLEQERLRAEMTREDYEKYVGWARKRLDKGEVLAAVEWCYVARLNASDRDAFLRQDWVGQVRDSALAKADELRQQHKWRDALPYYGALLVLFDDDPVFKPPHRECYQHARLEEEYKADRDWRDSLEGIDANLVEEALWRIDQKYADNVDFKKMSIAGHQQLLLLAESPTLQEQVPGLVGERGRDFAARIEACHKKLQSADSITYRKALDSFRRALQINSETVQLPEAMLVREYMNAALDELDEFTSVIWPKEFKEFEKHTRGDFIGVGIQIRNKYNADLKTEEILVVTPLEDTPAYRAGIQADDVITKVNDQSMLGVPVAKAVEIITGPEGSKVSLTIRRRTEDGAEKEFEVQLERTKVDILSVKGVQRRADDEQRWAFLLDPKLGVAYVRVTSFQENTLRDLDAALRQARSEGMRGLILDLRFNPGGLLKTAVDVASLFLSKGDRIVSTKGMRSEEWASDCERDGPYRDLPLIVLVNEASASASEIVCGAIRDHRRGPVIGERTYGKFSVQNLIQLVRSEAHLKLTTARYYLPSGQSLHREPGASQWGVVPDISIPLAPKEIAKIRFLQRDFDVLGATKTSSEEELKEAVKPPADETKPEGEAPDGNQPVEEQEKDENRRPRRDPQLETALLMMRMQLVNAGSAQIATGGDAKTLTPPADKQQ